MDEDNPFAVMAKQMGQLAGENAAFLALLVSHLEAKGLTSRAEFADMIEGLGAPLSETTLFPALLVGLRAEDPVKPIFTVIDGGRDE